MKEKLKFTIELTGGHGILSPHELKGDNEYAEIFINNYSSRPKTTIAQFLLKRDRVEELSDMLLRYLRQCKSFDKMRQDKKLLELE